MTGSCSRATTGVPRDFFGIRVPGWAYVEYQNGDRELYNMRNDPHR